MRLAAVHIMDSLSVSPVELRLVEESDMDALFEQRRDPESVQMAAFTPDNPDDRQSFDAHMARVLSSPDATNRAITCDGHLVGSIASFVMDGQREVTYWIDRAAWGQHIASRALAQLLDIVPERSPACSSCQRQRRLAARAREGRLRGGRN